MYGRYGKTAAEAAGKMNPNIAANIRSRDELCDKKLSINFIFLWFVALLLYKNCSKCKLMPNKQWKGFFAGIYA